MGTQLHVRGLQSVWVQEHGRYVFVWCADDGDTNKNHRLAYFVGSSAAEFAPTLGKNVLVNQKTVYGVPYKIESINGAIKVYYSDLTTALAWPNTNTVVDPLKDPQNYGFCVEGLFDRDDDQDSIVWSLKEKNLHNNPVPLLEVTDLESVDDSTNPYGAPSGALLVEYERDSTGRIKTDDSGRPLVAQIDADNSSTPDAQSHKLGYLALTFVEDYFGEGLHGWIGGQPPPLFPFKITKKTIAGVLNLLVRPGTVNQLVPQNIMNYFPIGAGFWYVKLVCQTNGKTPTQITLQIDTSPISPTTLIAESTAPPTFYALIGVVNVVKSATGLKAKIFQIVYDNLIALAQIAFITSNIPTQPGEEPYTRWWEWLISSAIKTT